MERGTIVDALDSTGMEARSALHSAHPTAAHGPAVERCGAYDTATAAAPRVTVQIDTAGAARGPSRGAHTTACDADLTVAAHAAAGTAVGGVGLQVDAAREAPFGAERARWVANDRAAATAAGHPGRAHRRARTAMGAVPLEIDAGASAGGLSCRAAGRVFRGTLDRYVGRSVPRHDVERGLDGEVVGGVRRGVHGAEFGEHIEFGHVTQNVGGDALRRRVGRDVRGHVGGAIGRLVGGLVGCVEAAPHHAPRLGASGREADEQRHPGAQAKGHGAAMLQHPEGLRGVSGTAFRA